MIIIPPNELFSTSDEWHAFVIGFFEVICPLPPRVKIAPAKPEILKEYHYYMFGRGCGIGVWLILLAILLWG